MKLYLTYFIFLISFSYQAIAVTPIVLDEKRDAILFTGKYIDYLEDSESKLTIQEVASQTFVDQFSSGFGNEIVTNDNVNSSYWIKLTIINNAKENINWVFELYEFRIDYFEIYLPKGDGQFEVFKGGSKFPFQQKKYLHKNFVYNLLLNKGQPTAIYCKIKAERAVFFIGMIRSFEKFLGYATTEYYMLALFYGVVLAMALFNLFIFFSTFDSAYFYYVLYVLSVGLFGLTQDGLGFEYLWPEIQSMNIYMPLISTFSMVVWALFYARSFLNTKNLFPILDKGILFFLLFRTLIFIISFFYPEIIENNYLNILPLLYIYIVGIIAWTKGNSVARFYVLAFTLLFVGFTTSVLNTLHILSSSPIVVYGFNIGVLCEMVLLSLALADRIKVLTKEKEEAQKEMIVQFKEKELLKDELNKELEAKVLERTQELENKNRELDTFVYRSSHDIKGPLKSIIGLAAVAQLDVKDDESRKYFDHILKTSKKLDDVVDHLMEVMEIKEATLQITKINFSELIQRILDEMNAHPNFCKFKTIVNINQKNDFYSDVKLLAPVIENIIENSIKYIDESKDNPMIRVNVEVNNGKAVLNLSDNGVGIDKQLQEKIFDMFYEVNPNSNNSGVGLYKTKICIDKLQGALDLKSEEGIGTSFTISLKNYN